MYTLGEAAKATGKGKTTIQKAIKSGKVSAAKGVNGEWQIDPAELHRVYPLVNIGGNSKRGDGEQEGTVKGNSWLEREVEIRDEKIAALERELLNRQTDVADLRRRLDQSEDERRKSQTQLTALLTDQRENKEDEPQKRSWRIWPWAAIALFTGASLLAYAVRLA